MTQSSRPQADHITSYPFPSDPGPYSADQWAQVFQIAFTGDQQATQGPLRYLNELAPTTNASTEVYVATGAGFVNGRMLISTESETFTIPAGPVATRIDIVVMCENNTNAEITATDAGRPFIFPNDLSEYTATPAIPAYSARLVIVRGADGAGAPVLDTTNSKYMVELARYTINNVPTISAFTDNRDFCLYASTIRTRTAFVQVNSGWNVTLAADVTATAGVGSAFSCVLMTDPQDVLGFASWQVPKDFVSGLTAESVIVARGTGDIYGRTSASTPACGEAPGTGLVAPARTAEAATNGIMGCHWTLSLPGAAIDDVVLLEAGRQAANVLDTVGADCECIGFIMTYTSIS
jgi:hypothetical protein